MSATAQSNNYTNLQERIRAWSAQQKSASTSPSDPREQSAPSAKKTDGDDTGKLLIPSMSRPENANGNTAAQSMPAGSLDVTKPGGAGENVPAPGKVVDPSNESPPSGKMAAVTKQAADALARIQKLNVETLAPSADKAAANAAAIDISPAQAQDFYVKLAHYMLETDTGREAVKTELTKKAGAEAAARCMHDALDAQRAFLAHEKQAAAAESIAEGEVRALIDEFKKTASAEDLEYVQRCAEGHAAFLAQIQDPELQMCYKQGAADAMAVAGAPDGAGAPPPEIPGESGPAGLEELAALLAELVQSGQIPQEVAQEFVAKLQASQGGGAAPGAPPGPEGGAPPKAAAPPAGGGGEAPPAAEEEAEKEAYLKMAAAAVPLVFGQSV